MKILTGDAVDMLASLPDESVQCCVTSPPYFGLRSYLPDGHPDKALEIGLEPTPQAYVARLVAVFREVRRVLKGDGVLWLNLGDSYSSHPGQRKISDKVGNKQITLRGSAASPSRSVPGLKPKDLIGIPWRVAFALQEDGWWLRQDIIFSKPNPMPESVTDRCTKSHEYLFLLAKSERYHFDAAAIAEPASGRKSGNASHKYVKAYGDSESEEHRTKAGLLKIADTVHESRNRRSVWTVATKPCSDAHFAVMPDALVDPCILAGSRVGDTVLDPFFGSGTVGRVAERLGRDWIGIDLNPAYLSIQQKRTAQAGLAL